VQTCIWRSWCRCHSLSLASVKSRLVLPFWYWLTHVVPDKGLLNRCVCVCVFIFKHTGDRLWWVTTCWQHGIVVSGVWYMNEVTLRRAWLVLGWVTLFGLCSLSWYLTISVCNQPTRSTQPASLRVANSSTSFGCGKGSTTLGDPNCCALYLYLLPFTCVFHWTVMGQINLTVFFDSFTIHQRQCHVTLCVNISDCTSI